MSDEEKYAARAQRMITRWAGPLCQLEPHVGAGTTGRYFELP